MINLLPDETKRDIRAARMNVLLLRYVIATVGGLVLLVIFYGAFYTILLTNQQKATTLSSENAKKAASLSDVRTAAESYRNNLTIASQIIDNGIKYTDVIIAITKLLPKGVVLNGLNLSSTTFGQQTSFQASAVDYKAAEQLKTNFQSSKLFTNVYFKVLTLNGATGQGAGTYPVSVDFSAKLDKTGLPNAR